MGHCSMEDVEETEKILEELGICTACLAPSGCDCEKKNAGDLDQLKGDVNHRLAGGNHPLVAIHRSVDALSDEALIQIGISLGLFYFHDASKIPPCRTVSVDLICGYLYGQMGGRGV